jgi:hypothetical protein
VSASGDASLIAVARPAAGALCKVLASPRVAGWLPLAALGALVVGLALYVLTAASF